MRWTKMSGAGRDERLLELILRVGVAGCFIGHGAFGLIGKAAWLPYFGVVGIGEELAWVLMPVVGTLDILVGISALLSPRPAVLACAAVWALWTALLRPLAGESAFEALERAGNYGVPLALLVMAGLRQTSWRSWLAPLDVGRLTADRRAAIVRVLRATTVLLLVGHAGLALLEKPLLVAHVTAVGLPASSVTVMGVVELALAGAVAVGSVDGVLLFVLAWKLATEALYPVTGAPGWEFVERAGSYVAPLTLWLLVRRRAPVLVHPSGARAGGAAAALVILFGGLGVLGGSHAEARDVSSSRERVAGATAPDSTLLDRLRAGGLVLACRHAVTDRSRGDRRPVDLQDRSTQRVLSDEGEAQARRLGTALRRLRIPVGRVLASPYFRTSDSAELTFGRVETHRGLMYGNGPRQREARRRFFTHPPREGANRALMTHQGILYGMLPEVERGSIEEGDCVVVLPRGSDGLEVLAELSPGEWEDLP